MQYAMMLLLILILGQLSESRDPRVGESKFKITHSRVREGKTQYYLTGKVNWKERVQPVSYSLPLCCSVDIYYDHPETAYIK